MFFVSVVMKMASFDSSASVLLKSFAIRLSEYNGLPSYVYEMGCTSCGERRDFDADARVRWERMPDMYVFGSAYLCDGCLGRVSICRTSSCVKVLPRSVAMSDGELDEFVGFVQNPIHKFLFILCAFKERILDEDGRIKEGDEFDVTFDPIGGRQLLQYFILRDIMGGFGV